MGKDNGSFLGPLSVVVGEAVLKFIPGQHLGESEEDDARKDLGGLVIIEADREAAASAVEIGRGHDIVFRISFHGAKLMI